jgi:hypothetical protein
MTAEALVHTYYHWLSYFIGAAPQSAWRDVCRWHVAYFEAQARRQGVAL